MASTVPVPLPASSNPSTTRWKLRRAIKGCGVR